MVQIINRTFLRIIPTLVAFGGVGRVIYIYTPFVRGCNVHLKILDVACWFIFHIEEGLVLFINDFNPSSNIFLDFWNWFSY